MFILCSLWVKLDSRLAVNKLSETLVHSHLIVTLVPLFYCFRCTEFPGYLDSNCIVIGEHPSEMSPTESFINIQYNWNDGTSRWLFDKEKYNFNTMQEFPYNSCS